MMKWQRDRVRKGVREMGGRAVIWQICRVNGNFMERQTIASLHAPHGNMAIDGLAEVTM